MGLGNLLLSDEGVGVHVAQRLQQMQLPGNVEVVDGGTGGYELIEHFRGKTKAVIIDCVMADAAPGTMMRLTLDELTLQSAHPFSAHQGGVFELLAFIKTLTPAPRVIVYGIVPSVADQLGTTLSTAVELSVPTVIDAVLEEVQSQSFMDNP
jgi:hydrogenase maturation protease